MIIKEESEIHGCKVNVTWSIKEICTITETTVRFREVQPLAIELKRVKWRELKVPATTFHLLSLECDKGYEIGVSSWFGKVQSDWSVSWRVKTRSAGAKLCTLCQIPMEIVTFVFPRVLMFSETKSRETSELEGKQN